MVLPPKCLLCGGYYESSSNPVWHSQRSLLTLWLILPELAIQQAIGRLSAARKNVDDGYANAFTDMSVVGGFVGKGGRASIRHIRSGDKSGDAFTALWTFAIQIS